MHLSHTPAALSISFDDPTLVSAASLVPVMCLADTAGLSALAQHRMSIAGDKGANAGAKITTLVAGLVAGADSIDDMDLLHHGGMSRLFTRTYAPSTLGFFLRAFTFGHVRQLDAVASCFLTNLADQSPGLVPAPTTATSGYVFSVTPVSAGSMLCWRLSPRQSLPRWSWPSACAEGPVVRRVGPAG